MSDSLVVVTIEGGVLEVRMNRPEKKNALTNAMYESLADALGRAAASADVRVILFSAEGDFFCAGNDLAEFAATAQSNAADIGPGVRRFLLALNAAQKPVVAAVHGHAVGVGVTMLLHCDLVYIAEDAKLTTPFVSLGLVPEAASSLTFSERFGHVRAFAMLGLGEAMSGREAAAAGVANAALPAGEVLARARKAAQMLAAKPAGALLITKRLMRDGGHYEARMREEFELFAERLKTPEAQQAFAAFLNKRA
jgi:enoyl-CoA hydratase/carnithine racemase